MSKKNHDEPSSEGISQKFIDPSSVSDERISQKIIEPSSVSDEGISQKIIDELSSEEEQIDQERYVYKNDRGNRDLHFMNLCRHQDSVYTCAVDSFLEIAYSTFGPYIAEI